MRRTQDSYGAAMVAADILVLAAGAALPYPHPPLAAFYDSQTLQAGHHAKETATLRPRARNVLMQAQIGHSLVWKVLCCRRVSHAQIEQFLNRGTKTNIEVSNLCCAATSAVSWSHWVRLTVG